MDWNCEGLNRVFECDGPQSLEIEQFDTTWSSTALNTHWYNNGEYEIMCLPKDIPDGWVLGRIMDNTGPRPNMQGPNHPRYGQPSNVLGTIWINNGKDHKMVFGDEIPEGWVKGRLNVQSNKEQFRQQGLNNNPNAKTYRIRFRNGDVVECHQLSKWGRENDIKYSALKSVLRRTREISGSPGCNSIYIIVHCQLG